MNKYSFHIDKSLFYKKIKLSTPYILHVVDKLEEYKPYLITEKYGLEKDYWEILLRVNKVTNPFNIKEGRVLIIPKIEELNNYTNE